MILEDDPKAYAIMGCAMRVHSILGYGFFESAYGDALEIEFKKAGIPYVREDNGQIYCGMKAVTRSSEVRAVTALGERIARSTNQAFATPWDVCFNSHTRRRIGALCLVRVERGQRVARRASPLSFRFDLKQRGKRT